GEQTSMLAYDVENVIELVGGYTRIDQLQKFYAQRLHRFSDPDAAAEALQKAGIPGPQAYEFLNPAELEDSHLAALVKARDYEELARLRRMYGRFFVAALDWLQGVAVMLNMLDPGTDWDALRAGIDAAEAVAASGAPGATGSIIDEFNRNHMV